MRSELTRGGKDLAEFLDYDMDPTTAPQEVVDPEGYYRAVARRLVMPAADELDWDCGPCRDEPCGDIIDSFIATTETWVCPAVSWKGEYRCRVVGRRHHPTSKTPRGGRPHVIELLECGREEVCCPSDAPHKHETCSTHCRNHPVYRTEIRLEEQGCATLGDGVVWDILQYTYPDGRVELRKVPPVGY